MKRVIIKELHQGSTSSSSQLAISYGKDLHLLKPTDKIDQGAFSSFKIEKSHAFEN
jgi:hypothetical protein